MFCLALELLDQMLCFDPSTRVTIPLSLEHPWLAAYHDPADEPDCPVKYEQWRDIESLETMEQFREAIWKEVEDYRREVRGLGIELSALSLQSPISASPPPLSSSPEPTTETTPSVQFTQHIFQTPQADLETVGLSEATAVIMPETELTAETQQKEAEDVLPGIPSISPGTHRRSMTTTTDPMLNYGFVRRSSILLPSRQGSTYNSPVIGSYVPTFVDNLSNAGQGTVVFPTQGYVMPARSRTGSTVGGEVTRKVLRTLSTVSIHESREGLPGGLAGIAPIGKYITQANTEADAPPSEVPNDFGIKSENEEDQADKKQGRFIIG